MNRPSWTQNLNEEQWNAVSAPDGPVLVIAAAGTGKTQTLTHRVAWLVREKGVRPWEILLLTFTNRAAREMLARAEQLVGGNVGGWWGGTFHHIANRILRRHADRLGYPQEFTILDQDDSEKLIRECSRAMVPKEQKFPAPGVLSGIFGLASSKEEDIEETARAHFSSATVDFEQIVKVHEEFTQRKRALGAMDFDDLLINALRLLRECPDIAADYQNKFKYVLVDEYQDTNKIQAALIDLLVAQHRNILAVGDDFQSIYSWRGADFRNILSFEKNYPGAHIYFLETNYRSRPEILEVANQVIAGSHDQYPKTMRAIREPDVKPVRAEMRDGNQQADYVAGKIRQLLDSGDIAPHEIVILYRSHFHSLELQFSLQRAQIPFTVVSGVRFFEQAHIKDICSLPRLAANPTDRLAFDRLLELLPKVGPKRTQSMWAEMEGHLNLRDIEKLNQITKLLPPAAREDWDKLLAPLWADPTEWMRLLERPDELIFRFKESFYNEFAEETFENFKRRLEDVDGLATFSARYENTREFLSEMALLTNTDHTQQSAQELPDHAIRLSTIHQAKGLEWKAVFVLWLVDGMFPAAKSLEEAVDDAEERRLFYVAITRARDYLWLCVPKMRLTRDKKTLFCPPSRFMEDIHLASVQLDRPAPPPPISYRRW